MDYVIIVAGGKGLRMGTETPKQFLPVAGKPILMRTIERFYEYNADTPTSIYESAVFQWLWLEDRIADGSVPAGARQINSPHGELGG